MTERATALWLIEQLETNTFKPLSQNVPWQPISIAEMRELLKRPPVYEVKEIK